MQLMPDTAKGYGVTNVNDVSQNLEAGTKMFKELLNKYKGNMDYAMMGYNWGPANVDAYLGGKPTTKCSSKGCAIPPETQKYPATYRGYYNCFKDNLGAKCK